eukprot:12343667-Alexandrium_andersonii.AAC.1
MAPSRVERRPVVSSPSTFDHSSPQKVPLMTQRERKKLAQAKRKAKAAVCLLYTSPSPRD